MTDEDRRMSSQVDDHERRITKMEVKQDYTDQNISKLINSLDDHVRQETRWQEKIVDSITTLAREVARFKWGLYGAMGVIVIIWAVAKDFHHIIQSVVGG